MYIGSTDARGLHHLVYEVVDNSIDEVLAGACTIISVKLHEDGSCTVVDNGRGIPSRSIRSTTARARDRDDHPARGLEVRPDRLQGLRGLHGVGVHVVNALSEWLEVRVRRNGQEYFQRYERGAPVAPLKVLGPAEGTGTETRFKPDTQVFETVDFERETVSRRLKELSFLNPTVTIHFSDERTGAKESFHHAGGIVEFVQDLNSATNRSWSLRRSICTPSATAPISRSRCSTTTATTTPRSPSSTTSTPSTVERTSSGSGPRSPGP